MKAPRFQIGARVVSPSGSIFTVIGNEITAKGINTSVEYSGTCVYPEAELEHADPAALDQIALLSAAVVAANQRVAEAQAAVAAARTKKRSR